MCLIKRVEEKHVMTEKKYGMVLKKRNKKRDREIKINTTHLFMQEGI